MLCRYRDLDRRDFQRIEHLLRKVCRLLWDAAPPVWRDQCQQIRNKPCGGISVYRLVAAVRLFGPGPAKCYSHARSFVCTQGKKQLDLLAQTNVTAFRLQ